jgi:hypothetical protein
MDSGKRALLLGMVVAWPLLACGPRQSQITFVSNERPNGYTPQGGLPPAAAHQENPNGGASPAVVEEEAVEPSGPVAETKEERALVHVHGPKDAVCSGVVVGPRLVATTQRCLRGQPKGVTSFGTAREYRVEIASSTLTWTNRTVKQAIVPHCDEPDLDIAILVLDEPAPPLVTPLRIASAPNTGAKVQALGYGRCKGNKAFRERNGTVRSRDARAVVIDMPLCKGDIGGPVLDNGDVIGLISRRDDPDGSPLRTTTIARLDTIWARDLFAQAKQLSEAPETAKLNGVTCK